MKQALIIILLLLVALLAWYAFSRRAQQSDNLLKFSFSI